MIQPIAFSLGRLTIHWYGLIISIALLLGFSMVIYRSKNTEITTEFFLDFFIIGVPVSLIGARLYYVIFNFDYYINNPLQIVAIWKGGIAIHGAVLGGLIVLVVLTKRRRLSFLKIVDIIAPALILGQAIGRWGNFINQEAYGGVVSEQFISKFPDFIKNQMYIEGNYHHPTFLYESIWNLLIFGILIWLDNKDFIKEGDIFFSYLIGYSIGRFFIEGLRTDSLMFFNIQVAQLVSIFLILFGFIMIFLRHRSH
jgi:phosphatidylglycerol:prolipoprotein diacylglycerol transferase